MALEILALRNGCKKGEGVPMFERSEFGYDHLIGIHFSQNIVSLEFFVSFCFKTKRKHQIKIMALATPG